MEQSFFIQWIAKFFPGITINVVNTLNGTNQPVTYLHRTMLAKEYSITGKWDAVSVANTNVAADVVAFDSDLPLKKRPSSSKANGEIPKMGMKLWLNETQLTELNLLVNQPNVTDAQIVQKLFADTPRVITGVYERNEALFLEGLSAGVIVVQDDKNTGVGIRLDFNYLAKNQFTSTTAWGETGAKTFDDLSQLKKEADADGNVIIVVMTDQATVDNMASDRQAIAAYASSQNYFGDTSNLPSLDFDQLNVAVRKKYGFQIEVINRTVNVEKNGKSTKYKPWKPGMLVGLTTRNVGQLIYADLAESVFRVDGVSYQLVDDFILVSKYRHNEPAVSEYTAVQARVAPIISGVDGIYTLDTTVTKG